MLIWVFCFVLGLSGGGESLVSHQQTWWYGNHWAHSQELLSYKDKVTLETSAVNVSWSGPTCTISTDSLNSSTAELLCSRPGLHMLNIEGTDTSTSNITQSTVYIPLESSPYCYLWKTEFFEVQENSTISNQVLVQVWIGATTAEDNVQNDDDLTVLFHSLGERPRVSFVQHLEGNITSVGYNSSCNCWEFEIETIPSLHEFVVTMSGGNTAVMDCGIRPTKHAFFNNRLAGSAFSINSTYESFVVLSAVEPPKLFKDEHSLGITVVAYSGINFITLDSFRTIKSFQIEGVSSAIQEVAFTLSTVCVIAGGELLVVNVEGSQAIQQTGVPSHVIQHVSARGYTDSDGSSVDLVALWAHEENEAIHLSQDGGLNFVEISLQSVGSVHSVLFHPMHKEVNILLSLPEESFQAKFLYYDVDSQEWNTESLHFNYSGGNLSAVFFPGVFGDLLIWEDTALYYNPNKGITVHSLPVYTSVVDTTMTPFNFYAESYIKHTSVGPGGQFTVLTHDNRLFYGTTVVGYAVEIQSGVQPDSEVVFTFNILGELKAVIFKGDGVGIRKVPTYSLLLSSLYPPPACPYLQWEHNVIRPVYYLDSNESLTLWASVIPRPWQANKISFTISDPSAVTYHADNQLVQTAIAGSVERNMSIHIQPSQLSANGSHMLTAIKFSVSSNNLACQDTTEVVTQLSIQCPPSRHIRVKRPSSHSDRCSNFEDLTYKISKNHYDPELRGRSDVRDNVDKEVQYNHSLYGCPIRVPYTQRFRPVLELYDGSQFIKEMEADFVIWEVHGRTDFKYTANAEQAGCISAPQSWTEMTQGGIHPSLAWTPQTYRHCFQTSGDQLDKKATYQILNSTGASSLSWYGHNGIYIFTATVVAADCSFCNLTASLAVEVYGATKTSYVGYIFLVLTCLSGALVLVVSYFAYRHKTGRHEKKE